MTMTLCGNKTPPFRFRFGLSNNTRRVHLSSVLAQVHTAECHTSATPTTNRNHCSRHKQYFYSYLQSL